MKRASYRMAPLLNSPSSPSLFFSRTARGVVRALPRYSGGSVPRCAWYLHRFFFPGGDEAIHQPINEPGVEAPFLISSPTAVVLLFRHVEYVVIVNKQEGSTPEMDVFLKSIL